MTQNLTANLPPPQLPLVNAGGLVNEAWLVFFLSLFTRTGGSQGVPSSGTVLPPVSVPLTPSPFVYTAAMRGVMFISGGGISNLEFSRQSAWYKAGSFYGCFFLAPGDQLRITYLAAPSLVFASN